MAIVVNSEMVDNDMLFDHFKAILIRYRGARALSISAQEDDKTDCASIMRCTSFLKVSYK